ncbi:MAG: EamA family transporter [Pseudomonadota bacterium]
MQPFKTDEQRATFYMLLAALTFSLFPIVNVYGVRSINVLTLSVVGIVISGLFFFVLVLLSGSARRLFYLACKQAYVGLLLSLSGLFLLLSYVTFAQSLKLIGVDVATVLFESHLVILVFTAPFFVRRLNKPEGSRPYIAAISCFIIVSGIGTYEAFRKTDFELTNLNVAQGVMLAAASSIAVTVNVLFRQLASDRIRQVAPGCSEFDVSLVANTISRFLPLLCLVFIWEDLNFKTGSLTYTDWGLLIFYGVVVIGLNNIFFLMAVNQSSGSTVNALRYSGPVISLILLWMLGEITDVSFLLAFAYSAVVITSFFTVMDPRKDPATVALIAASVGMTGLLSAISGSNIEDYFAATVSPLVLFSVIVAFLIDRIKTSIRSQRNLRIEIISQRPKGRNARELIAEIDGLENKSIDDILESPLFKDDPKSLELLLKYLSLRKTNVTIGEWISLIGAAGVAIFASIVYRGDGFLFDIYALLLSTTLIFLVFQIIVDVRFPNATLPLEQRAKSVGVVPIVLALLVICLQTVTLYR